MAQGLLPRKGTPGTWPQHPRVAAFSLSMGEPCPITGRQEPQGDAHTQQHGATEQTGPLGSPSPGGQGPHPQPRGHSQEGGGTAQARSPGREVARGPGWGQPHPGLPGAYPSRSCRPRGAGSRACTRRDRSPVCSRTCADSRRCASGTHLHLDRDTGPRVSRPRDPDPGPLTEDVEPCPGAQALSSGPTLARAEWGEGGACPSHLASLLGGRGRHLGGGQNVGSPGGQRECRERRSGQCKGCRGHWAEVGRSPAPYAFQD